jgi:sugar transferase (PEP-CTERM/EpsH1 system associated)
VKTIRIMHVVDTLETGGLENGVVNLIRHMDTARFEHVVCAIRNLGALAERLPAERIRVMCLDKTRSGRSCQVLPLAKRLREVRPQIVHARNWGTIEAILAGISIRPCALVYSEHGVESLNSGQEPLRRVCLRRMAFELADRVFSVSYQLRDFHAKRTGFPASKIGVIHNGVDIRRFCPDPVTRQKARQQFGILPEEYCVGAVGRVEPVKGLIHLLRAVAALPSDGQPWRLLIAGEGSELQALQQFVSGQPNLQGRVHFVGEIREIPTFLNGLDVYTLPSISEGISNSLLEAMATGLPVVASSTGGNPEIVVDGTCGVLFPVGDSGNLSEHLLRLQSMPEERSRLGEKARQRVLGNFSLDAMVFNYEQFYAGLVQGPKAPGVR